MTGIPLWVLLAIWKLYCRFCRKKKPKDDEVEPIGTDGVDGGVGGSQTSLKDGKELNDGLYSSFSPTFSVNSSKQTDIL